MNNAPLSIGDQVISAVIKADAIQSAESTPNGTVFVWRANAAEQIEAALRHLCIACGKEHFNCCGMCEHYKAPPHRLQ